MRASAAWRALVVILVALAAGIGVAGWYMVDVNGRWNGATLEASRGEMLPEMERQIRDDVRHLSVDLGERNLEDDARHRALQEAGAWIRQRWESLGYAVREDPFSVKGRTVSNLWIEIRGTRRPSEIIVVSAQHDTLPGSPGANNNASGEAVLLQVASLLRGAQPGRTVWLVSFTTEEDPWFGTDDMGSVHFARRCRERGEDVRAMLSLDSVGYYRHEPGTQHLPFPFSALYPDRGDFLAFIGNLSSRSAVLAATRGFHRGTAFPAEGGLAPEWVEGVTWSDHASFWRFGYPGVQVTDTGGFRSPHHTRPTDTWEKLDYPALARISLGIYGSILELAEVER